MRDLLCVRFYNMILHQKNVLVKSYLRRKNSLKYYKKAVDENAKSCYNETDRILRKRWMFLITPTYEWQFTWVEDADFTKIAKNGPGSWWLGYC